MKFALKSRRHRVIGLLTGLVLLVVGVYAAVAIGGGSAQASDPPAVGTSADDTPLDPVAEALGVDTPEEIVDLQRAQERLTAIGETDTEAGTHVNDVRSDLGQAVDDLYSGVADDPQAARARDWWRQCMAVKGTPYDSPDAIEAAIGGPRDEVGQLDGHPLDAILANRDDCETEASSLLDALLEGRFPEWAAAHEGTLEEYRDLVESVSP